MKKLELNQIKNPTSVTVAAQRLEISQCAIWILVRQNIVPVALQYSQTVIDYDLLCEWIDTHSEVLEKLQQVRTAASAHPLVEMFVTGKSTEQ